MLLIMIGARRARWMMNFESSVIVSASQAHSSPFSSKSRFQARQGVVSE